MQQHDISVQTTRQYFSHSSGGQKEVSLKEELLRSNDDVASEDCITVNRIDLINFNRLDPQSSAGTSIFRLTAHIPSGRER